MYFAAISKNQKVTITKSMPTVDSLTQHLKRVYLKVQDWLCEEGTFDPTDLGWTLDGNLYTPVKMTQSPGTLNIMKMIFCACKTDCARLSKMSRDE